MRKFLQALAYFLLPIIVLLSLYVSLDPFRIFGAIEMERGHYIASSDDYFGVERYLANKRAGHHYNAFLFGNSKVMAFQQSALCSGISNCSFYNFGAPGESLLNIRKKLELAMESGDSLKEVWIILDFKILMNENNRHPNFQGPVYEHHPLVSDNSYLSFHSRFLQYFIKDAFFLSFFTHKFCGCWLDFMEGHFKKPEDFGENPYDPISNQVSNEGKASYPRERFLKTKPKPINYPTLSHSQLQHLQEMAELFKKHNTRYRIVFGPLIQAEALPEVLLQDFQKIFGAHAMFDFSAAHFGDADMWYNESHYGNGVGSLVIEQVAQSNTHL